MPKIDSHEIVPESDCSFSVVITFAKCCDSEKRAQLVASLANHAATRKMLDVQAMSDEQVEHEWMGTIWARIQRLR